MASMARQVKEFLSASAPFDTLDESAINSLVRGASIVYLTEEDKSRLLSAHKKSIFLVQNGQFSVKDSPAQERHLSEGEYFGYPAVLDEVDYPLTIRVDKPGLIYCIAREAFTDALEFPAVAQFFRASSDEALQNHAVLESNSMWLYKPLTEVTQHALVAAHADTSIKSAAEIMSQNRVSSLIITQDDKIIGIVTDRDLRTRVVAAGADVTQPVADIMTRNPAIIAQHRTLFDALALMSEKNIHHLPIVDRASRAPVGIVTASDVIRHQRSNVLFIISELAKADNLYELTRLAWQMPHYFASHAKRPGDFDIAGKVLSQATDIMTRKLIAFFARDHGQAPMAYTWLVYGSQAREDQTMGSDQDNGLLLERAPDASESAYFSDMAEYVCGGLAKCGIRLCDGNIMASNPKLRLSLDQAVEEARGWVKQPTSKAIMYFNIFLDVRAAAGDVELFRRLQHARMPLFKQSFFLAALARHANEVSVPLSMFQKFVFEKNAPTSDAIDLKVKAIAPVNNLTRLYALSNGLLMPATLARLAAMPANSGLSSKDADNLRDIWLFFNRLRWRHQLAKGVTDNYVSISELSSIEKHQLKAAFKAIERAQQAAVMKFSGGVG